MESSRKQLFHRMMEGNRLAEVRVKLNLSQEALAEAIGTTARSINRWEHNYTFPQPYYLERLCQVLRYTPEELFGASKETSQQATASPLLWNIPYPRNPFFTGRDALLASLETRFKQQQVALTQPLALHGLGGIGKTQIALEYVYRSAAAYQAVLWISAETYETTLASLLSIAQALDLPERHAQDRHHVVQAVTRWLSGHQGWLLICDNVEDLAALQPLLSSARQGSLLLTTRLQAVGAIAQQVPIEPLKRQEGLTFLLQRAKRLQPGTSLEHTVSPEHHAAQAIVEEMGGLPLALDQAGAYIEETQCSLEGYLRQYRQHRTRLLARRGSSSWDHPSSVQTTVSLSLQQVEQKSFVATQVLRFCAFLSPEAIPEEVLASGVLPGREQGPAPTSDPSLLDEAIAVLGTYSLVHRDPMTKTLSLHRLVQAVVQDGLSAQEQKQWIERVVTSINDLFPEVTHEMWNQCEWLVPHALQAVKHTVSWEQADEALATLLFKTGRYLSKRAQEQEAEPLLKRALHLREQALGPHHPLVAEVCNRTLARFRPSASGLSAQHAGSCLLCARG